MKKKFLIFAFAVGSTSSTYADDGGGLSAVAGQSANIASYLPFVQALCYAVAGVLAIAGAMAAYYALQSENGNARKAVMGCVGSCIAFVCMATSLPMFFGYDSEGSFTAMNEGNSSASTSTTIQHGGSVVHGGSIVIDGGGVPHSGIITIIPDLSDPIWRPDPIYNQHFINGSDENPPSSLPQNIDNTLFGTIPGDRTKMEQRLMNTKAA